MYNYTFFLWGESAHFDLDDVMAKKPPCYAKRVCLYFIEYQSTCKDCSSSFRSSIFSYYSQQ